MTSLPEDFRQSGGFHVPKKWAHCLSLKVDEDMLAALRAEAKAGCVTVSAVIRMAIGEGLPKVQADRIARQVTS